MKRFVNQRENLILETLDGVLIAAGAGKLSRVDGYPNTKVVMRRELDPTKVAIISGGGAGHEPAHAGFVGRGMLSAAVSGEVFASPSVDAVLDCIQAVTGEAGALLIVKNYTGDRLNFGLAAEKAKQMGLDVRMVVVGDDIAIPDAAQPRGLAGTLFVHKVAGYLAEAGASLDEVATAAEAVAKDTVSLGVALSSCTIPFQPQNDRLGPNEAELGLGIHGEPGVEHIELMDARSMIALMAERLLASLPKENAQYALLVNNLGSVPPMEMSILVNEIFQSTLADKVELLFGPKPLMTSLDMNGVSLSLVQLDDKRREALLAPVDPAAWPTGVEVDSITVVPQPIREGSQFQPSSEPKTREVLAKLCEALIDKQAELDSYDAKVGDGDTGSTIAAGAKSIIAELDHLPLAAQSALCTAIAEILAQSMGGSSGVLLSIMLTATGTALGKGSSWADALMQGLETMQRYGGASRGDRTMLDALLPAVEAMANGATIAEAAAAAHLGAESTKEMGKANAGRSSYLVSSSLIGVPDPGAVAAAVAFDAVGASVA